MIHSQPERDRSDGRKNPFLQSVPNALTSGECGVCHASNLTKFFECRSLDSGYASLYVCRNCYCLYNSTAESNELDVVEWQKRWAEDPEFYKVPTGDEFNNLVESAAPVFQFFEIDLGVSFSGTYMEIGAGSGIMAAAALRHFDNVNVLDHVQERLLKVKAIVGDNYNVVDFEGATKVKADVVLIWHAMEHFLNPGGVFQFCVEQLNADGHLLIQVPILTEEHVYPGHYYFYNEITFETLAERWGLRVHKFYYDHAMNAMTVALHKPADLCAP
jgi:SAM-dependent methyltransferase